MFVFTLQASHQELNRQQGGFLLDEIMSTVSKLQIVLEATTTAFDNGLKKATVSLQGFAKKTDEIHSKMDKFARKTGTPWMEFKQLGRPLLQVWRRLALRSRGR